MLLKPACECEQGEPVGRDAKGTRESTSPANRTPKTQRGDETRAQRNLDKSNDLRIKQNLGHSPQSVSAT
jgi:hypothetical protein